MQRIKNIKNTLNLQRINITQQNVSYRSDLQYIIQNKQDNDNLVQFARRKYIQKFGIPKITLYKKQTLKIIVETPRLSIQPIQASDYALVFKYLWSNTQVMKLYEAGSTLTIKQTELKIKKHAQKWDKNIPFSTMKILDKVSKQFIGTIGLQFSDISNSSQLQWIIKQQKWRQQYCYQAGGAICLFLSNFLRKHNFKINKNQQQFKTIRCTCHAKNIFSIKNVEKIGFSFEKQAERYGYNRKYFVMNVN